MPLKTFAIYEGMRGVWQAVDITDIRDDPAEVDIRIGDTVWFPTTGQNEAEALKLFRRNRSVINTIGERPKRNNG